MTNERLTHLFNQFQHHTAIDSYSELVSGHINDTYLIKTKTQPNYILQRINHIVFPNVPGLIQNKVSISNHIKSKLTHLSEQEKNRRVLTFIPTKNNLFYYLDENGNYWNVLIYIENSVTYERVSDVEIAYEGGKLFGEFINHTSDFDAHKLVEVIPNFHQMSYRYSQFDQALKQANAERKAYAVHEIQKVIALKQEMHILQTLKESGKIPIRVTHNDTKISNALFDTHKKGLCVIDTDTVMPGIIHYDFGDAIRTICNTAAEDETQLEMVNFNFEFYKSYTKGYLEQVASSLSPLDIKHLPLAAKTIIFIMGIRFLTDFLNNDIYYKAAYTHHNLDRSKNQFKLLESLTQQINEVQQFTNLYLH